MSSPETRTQGRALTFSRSLANIVKSKLSCSFFSKHQPAQPLIRAIIPPPPPPPPPRQPPQISRPRQLRRAHIPHYYAPQPHFIHRLPVEILSVVFVIGSEEDAFFPIVVSHVCRVWREISLHTPSLWRRICLTPHERMWRQRIHRARACSLDIELFPWRTTGLGVQRSQDLDPYAVQWYMHIVLPYIQQWRSLDMLFSEYSPHLWRAALAGFAYQAPALEELSLVYRLNDDTQEFVLFSEYAPRLRRVTIDGIRLSWLPSLFGNLSFLDYTHHGFTSGHQAVHDIISILAVSSRLVEFRVLFPRGQVPRLPSHRDYVTKRITLPYLTQLQLSVDGSDIPFELAHLVTLISSPRLSTLRLVDRSRGHRFFPSLKSFFYVYALPPTLRSVHVGHGWYDPRMIQPMAQSLSQLAEIVIKRSRLPEQVLNVNNRVRGNPMAGSINRTFQNSRRHYHIDHLNVQYFPGYKGF